MKLQTKATLGIFLIGSAALLVSTLAYQYQARQASLEEVQQDLIPLAKELANNADSIIRNKIQLARTLATSPTLTQALHNSNREYDSLTPEQRTTRIDQLDQRWRTTLDPNDPFIQSYITNTPAMLLRKQQQLLPGMYGEIFLTNRYGAMIATTGRLTTLAHAHKYWWQDSYNHGRGAVFLDDRGFDTSVQDVVLGIVVPIYEQGRISGLLKCNVLISGPLSKLVNTFNQHNDEHVWLVRGNGMIVSGSGQPLSDQLPESVANLIKTDKNRSTRLGKSDKLLLAITPVSLTLDSEEHKFGGKVESIDHTKGNAGEAWYMVISLDKTLALADFNQTSRIIFITGAGFILLGIILAWLLGRRVVNPIYRLAAGARQIGEGKLETRVQIDSRDEMAELATSLNEMAAKLSSTMASHDELSREVAQRKIAENKLAKMATTDELTGAHNRRYFGERLKEEMERSRRYDEPLALLMFDADHFKKINDRLGHDIGDMVLQKLVNIAQSKLRSQDALVRWGGEEFMIILPHTDMHAAAQLAERLRSEVASHDFAIPQHVTISLGLAQFHTDDTCDTFIKRADKTLYRAKEAGRNQLVTQTDVPTSAVSPTQTTH
jgi:diguanylate cyclase (GGDEF)-like protein